ncbi:H-NS family nucleoid-associated regulatory protein, partial [Paraburkholderia sp. EG287B]|uniref:H-NS family nucleoid-associated regulatory protein n=1 Tax=Paraburkholderia sp. EG287B TaxID=3237010 RepID=UPI0034D32267
PTPSSETGSSNGALKGLSGMRRKSHVPFLGEDATATSCPYPTEPEDIATSIAADQERLRAVRFRDASGNTWDGKGAPPQWVVQAISAGQSLEHFAIDGASNRDADKRTGADWRNDPFAGSRLATIKTEDVSA